MTDITDQVKGAIVDESPDGAEDQNASDDILKEAISRLELAEEAETEIRRLALDDLKFRSGEQWPDNIRQDRDRDGRPCLVINRLPQFVQQITNDQRQNRPAIKVHPVGSGADTETAKIIQGLIRHIEYNSNAEVAYDTAFESAATGGFGYFRIITDFVAPDSFDQEILIKRIRNPFSVFFDPYAQEPDGSDATWAFIVDDLSRDEYQEKYPDSKLAAPESDWSAIGNQTPTWVKSDSCRVAEYFYKITREEKIFLLSTGDSATETELPARMQSAQAAGIQCHVVRSRLAKVPVIKWCKMNGVEILEQTEWPGAHIPIIPVYGGELFVDGKRILESVIRHAKDPQRMYNYWKSAETEAIALAPRAPFIGAEGQFEGHEEAWKTANRRNHAYLEYKPTTIAGQAVPAPQRQTFEPAVQAISQASALAADDMKATTGIYDAALGNQSNDISGLAIQRRNTQTQTSNFHFVDNLTRSLRHAGRIIVDLIPKIYDTARVARIIGDDGSQEMITLNSPTSDQSGKPALYDLSVGRYDVTVDTGPSFASKRQEAAASMISLSQNYPQIMGIAGDLFVKNMDWPGAQEIADRIKKTLPPELQGDGKQPQIPPQVQAQLQQMNALCQKLDQENSELTKIIETKSLELQHKERVELMKLQAQIEMKGAELGSKEDIALLSHQIESIKHRLSLLNMEQPIEAPDDFNPQQSDGGNYAGFGHVGSGPTGGPMSPGQNPGVNP